jgi:hypothetical protein
VHADAIFIHLFATSRPDASLPSFAELNDLADAPEIARYLVGVDHKVDLLGPESVQTHREQHVCTACSLRLARKDIFV